MVEKPWLAVFIVTCPLCLPVVLDLFQLHLHSAIPCLCTLDNRTVARRSSVGGFHDCAGGIDILKFDKKSTEL